MNATKRAGGWLMPVSYLQLFAAAGSSLVNLLDDMSVEIEQCGKKYKLKFLIRMDLSEAELGYNAIENRVKLFYEDHVQWRLNRHKFLATPAFNLTSIHCCFDFSNASSTVSGYYSYLSKGGKLKSYTICSYYCNRLLFGTESLNVFNFDHISRTSYIDWRYLNSRKPERFKILSKITGIPINILYLDILTDIENYLVYGTALPNEVFESDSLPFILMDDRCSDYIRSYLMQAAPQIRAINATVNIVDFT